MDDCGYGFWPEVADAKKTRAEVDFSCSYVSEKTKGKEIRLYGINPFLSNGTQSLTFLDWYEHWLDTGLHFLNS